MSMINFQTPNLVNICYVPGSGGKFILNCIGLSQQVVLQDEQLAQQQLDGILSPKNKHDLLIERINNTDRNWTDLNLGCFQLFKDTTHFKDVPPVISKLSNSDMLFCLVSQSYVILNERLDIWPNSRCILFRNEYNFIREVRSSSKWGVARELDSFWANVRGDTWPDRAPLSLRSYNRLPEFIKNEIAEIHGNEILTHYYSRIEAKKIKRAVISQHRCLDWNCDWFLDEEIFLVKIKKLYSELNLKDFNAELILSLYNDWINKLTAINKHAGLV